MGYLRISAAMLALMTRASSACHTASPGRSTMSWMRAKLPRKAASLAASWLSRASRSCLQQADTFINHQHPLFSQHYP